MAKSVDIQAIISQFMTDLQPVDPPAALKLFTDNRTGAQYYECHVKASKIAAFGTTDVPLDPQTQAQYRANRKVVDTAKFEAMKQDAAKRRSFSNIVTEYTRDFDSEKPLKVIGGQHRFKAIEHGLKSGTDEVHGIKVYFGLDMPQRYDAQIISNTNIEASGALADRLGETYRGGSLRKWCQEVGILKKDEDFSDTTVRGGAIAVHLARTFIANYYAGRQVDTKDFAQSETTPLLYKVGKDEDAWDDFLAANPDVWKDKALLKAGKEFVRLVNAQRKSFADKKKTDFAEKGVNAAVLAAWAFVAGMLEKNSKRLVKHFALADVTKTDPLNAAALSKGRHKSDGSNYRGMGYRTDPRERSQLVELFAIQADEGAGIRDRDIKAAIAYHFAKQNILDGKKALEK